MARRRSKRRLWATIAVALLIAVPLVAAGCADRLILPPEVKAREGSDVERRMVRYRHGELEVYVTGSSRAKSAEPRAAVLQCSGGNAADVARMLAARWGHRAVEIWAFNYPGYGRSTGPRTLVALADASIDAFDALRREAGDRPIIAEGFSLSTAPALHVAANRDVAGVIVQNPPPIRELAIGHFSWWNLGLVSIPVSRQVPASLDSIANARRAKARAIFLTAELDRSVPLRFQRQIVDAYAGPKRVILQHGADHVAPLSEADTAALNTAMDWLLAAD